MSLARLVPFFGSSSSLNPYLAWSLETGKSGYIEIKFPLTLTKGVSWYGNQPCTRFKTFQHRKERGVIQHEFILLKLMDGSVCRVERTGDPNARLNGVNPEGSAARDIVQCFSEGELKEAKPDTSYVVSEVELPCEFDILDVLKICRAIREGEKTSNYTLQVYNCYFFSLAIQVCLTRLVAGWENEELFGAWLLDVQDAVKVLSTLKPPSEYPPILRLYSGLYTRCNETPPLMAGIMRLLESLIVERRADAPQQVAYHIHDQLWHSSIDSSLSLFIEEWAKSAFLKGVSRAEVLDSTASPGGPLGEPRDRLLGIFVDLMTRAGPVHSVPILPTGTTNQEPSARSGSNYRIISTSPRPVKQEVAEKARASYYSEIVAVQREMKFDGPSKLKVPKEEKVEIVVAKEDTPIRGSEPTQGRAEWGQYLWNHFRSPLHHMVLHTWGVRLFNLEPGTTPPMIIDQTLEKIVTELGDVDNITDKQLKDLTKEMEMLSTSHNAVWQKKPWDDVCDFIKQRTLSKLLEKLELESPKLKVKYETESETETTVSSFQERIIKRITDHGLRVEKYGLGSAKSIRVELEQTLPQVWRKIREDKTIGNVDRFSKLHALIIGINDYPNFSKLNGAVADADSVAEFLESDLKVPSSHIRNLRDGSATRQNIIDSIMGLWNNEAIQVGDPMLIYFAGHGGFTQALDEWEGRNGERKVQIILPYDHVIKDDDSPKPISYPTIAKLLNELSKRKGDNITVIFDSAHSGLRTGSLDISNKVSVDMKGNITYDNDSNTINTERGIANSLDDSHVLLTSCGPHQVTHEEKGRGLFTSALLMSMKTYGLEKLTYNTLIASLPRFESQTPCCYGKHQDRILFNPAIPAKETLVIPVEYEDGKILLQAGDVSGVTIGSIWEIYDSATMEGVPLGTFRAVELFSIKTILEAEDKSGDALYLAYIRVNSDATRTFARKIRAGVVDKLRVHFTPIATGQILPLQKNERANSYSVGSGEKDVGYVLSSEDTADLVVDLDSKGFVTFRLCDYQAERYGVAQLKHRMKVDRQKVEEVLFAAAKWKWHLQRKNTGDGEITDRVTVELVRVGEKVGSTKKMFDEEEQERMSTSGIVDLVVEGQNLYGVRLASKIRQPLYLRMFYFDSTDLSIYDLFGHATAKNPIMSERRFTIGDGGEGGAPLQFSVDPENELELGYLKVFWSTGPLELRDLEQKPAFDRTRGMVKSRWPKEGEVGWGTALLTIVQRSPLPPVALGTPSE